MKNKRKQSKSRERKRIMILASSDLYKDPRVYRQVIALQDHFDLVTVTNLSALHKDFSRQITHIVIDDAFRTYNSDSAQSSARPDRKQTLRESIISLKHSKQFLPRTAFALIRIAYRLIMALHVRYIIGNHERFKRAYFSKPLPARLKAILQNTPVDVILVNEIDCLPSAIEFGDAQKIIYDAHEFSLGEADESLTWRLVNKPLIRYLCNTYIPQADRMLTVCDGILNEYKRLYPEVRIDLVTNASPYISAIHRRRTGQPMRIIHHGLADRSRNIETMIECMRHLKNRKSFTLTLMLVYNDIHYVEELKSLANTANQEAGFEQVQFVAPVPLKEIVRTISQFDIQIIMTRPLNLNNQFSLPNKFFEAIQARNALAIGPITEMAKIVDKYDLGVISKTFDSADMAAELENLSNADVERFKQNAAKAARILNAEANAKKLVKIVTETLRSR